MEESIYEDGPGGCRKRLGFRIWEISTVLVQTMLEAEGLGLGSVLNTN